MIQAGVVGTLQVTYSLPLARTHLCIFQKQLTGSLLGDLLLLPGLAMIAGGIKYKEQRFSPAVAGVSSVLLLVSVIGTSSPQTHSPPPPPLPLSHSLPSLYTFLKL